METKNRNLLHVDHEGFGHEGFFLTHKFKSLPNAKQHNTVMGGWRSRRMGCSASTHQVLPGWQKRTCRGSGSGSGGTPADPTARIRLRDPGLQRGGCRVALLLPGTARVFHQRALPRNHLWRRVFCAAAGPWGGTCALQRAGDAISQLLAAKHQRDMLGWFSAVERFCTLHEHAVVAYEADHQLFLGAQRRKSARSSAFGCWRCWNPNLNPKP